ncbi:MAG: hypothetical protein FWG87_08840 [Defluviitaleaceae bacterium]|nr:hypothetical protein [Defluviitaleaceae bacterium]
MVFLDNTARRPKQREVISGRINPSPTKKLLNTDLHGFARIMRIKNAPDKIRENPPNPCLIYTLQLRAFVV